MRLELVPVGRDERGHVLGGGACDLAAGRINPDRAMAMQFSHPVAQSLLRPELTAVVPVPDLGSVPIALTVPEGEGDLLQLVNAFLEQAKASGLVEARLDYWVRGKGAKVEGGPRWSIARDVLGLWKSE